MANRAQVRRLKQGVKAWNAWRVGREVQPNLIGAKFSNLDLRKLNFHNTKLSHAILKGSNLAGAKLSFARLDGANLDGVDLSGADLNFAELQGEEGGGEEKINNKKKRKTATAEPTFCY